MKFFNKKDGETFHIKSDSEIFLSIETKGESYGFLGSSIDFSLKNLTSFINEKNLQLSRDSLVKVILKETQKEDLKEFLSYFTNQKVVIRNNGFELYYMPATNTLRVSKEEELKKKKVLIIDDSKTICKLLEKIISNDKSLEVIGAINDPLLADDFIQKNKPDVITLDIHMPGLNGVELLKRIYPKYKIPTVMISSVSMEEGPLVMEALENGAVDYLQKPDINNIDKVSQDIIDKVTQAANVKKSAQKITTVKSHTPVATKFSSFDDKLIVIGSSTGGTQALREILIRLPDEIPPILIVQHIPAVFSKAFADRLNDQCAFEIKEASDGDEVVKNRVLIAEGGKHMKIIKKGDKYIVEKTLDEPVNRFRPSVDYMFKSVSEVVKDKKILSVILTGMGNDGAKGMKELKDKHASITIAQDESTSVVFGMPREAIKLGCVDHILPLEAIASQIISLLK